MSNRILLALLVALLFGSLDRTRLAADDPEIPLPAVKHLIDTHIHLYDTRREGGVPWPPEHDKILYRPHLPDEFKRVSQPAGATGVVIVEASDRMDDNSWLLDLVAGDDFFVAVVGNIDPYREDFGEHLNRFAKDPRFVGIRARNPQPIDYADPRVVKNFRALASAGLTLDILVKANGIDTIRNVDRLAQAIPELRIVVNHALGYKINGSEPEQAWMNAVDRLAKNPNVYCKVSGLFQRSEQQPAPHDPDYYRPVLDVLWNSFGSKRLIYGSNWPVSNKSGDYVNFVRMVNGYFSTKGQGACERYFWKNAMTAYNLKLNGR